MPHVVSPSNIMEAYQGVTLKIEGHLLTAKQVEVIVPLLNAYHDGRISRSKFVAMARSACKKAGLPIGMEEEDHETR